ncbi:MAG TPA: MOSC N-terminal beta barrel domain-containing protein [Steroidobacteraceae bacterium]
MARIASLHIYPVKSCRGIDVDSTLMTPTGPEWDRRWMIVTATDQFITQRSHPKLATIAVAVGDGKLRLSAEGQAPLVLDVDHAGESRRVTIWNDECRGVDAGDEAAAWFSGLLDDRFRLVRIDPALPRLANPKYVGPEPNPVTFTDGYPILMISNESLAELNRRLPEPLPMARFRPNIVIEGVAAHAEDAMTLFRTDSIVLRGVKLCTRCSVTTTDQQTGARDPHQQPLRALGKYRHDYALKGVTFGQNCTVVAGVGKRLRVGAEFSIDAHQV